jgi:CheY-like chemotaxis protein
MFAQVDRSRNSAKAGLGIGLTIVKRLVEMHGGSVEAHSRGRDQGSQFIVRLPTAFARVGEQESDMVESNSPPSASRRILVVDDNKDSAVTLAMILKIMGHDARSAHDGFEAIEIAESFRPEVMFLDIGMPKMNGYETCRRIRQQPWGSSIVIIALTGWGQAEDYRRSKDAGFNHHLVKPVKPPVLRQVLAELPAQTA